MRVKARQVGLKWQERVARLGIETCYNGARRRGNESITSRKQLGKSSRCLGINSEKAPGTSRQNEDKKKMADDSLNGKMVKIVARSQSSC